MKRLTDILISFSGLVIMSPVLLAFILLIWLQDFKSPFYVAKRAGKGKKPFNMIKLRSMVVNAEASGGSSTAADDKRITWVGHLIRKFKLDEISQLWNVLKGDMSLIGPRPNVIIDVECYTAEEQRLVSIRPGITDISSIVFSDEGEILKGSADPDLLYNQIIRPWKSRLGLIYVDNVSLALDLRLIALTILAIVKKPLALNGVSKILQKLGADDKLQTVARRSEPLPAYPPPGSDKIVESRAL